MHFPAFKAAVVALNALTAPLPCSPITCPAVHPLLAPVQVVTGVTGIVLDTADGLFNVLTPDFPPRRARR